MGTLKLLITFTELEHISNCKCVTGIEREHFLNHLGWTDHRSHRLTIRRVISFLPVTHTSMG